MIGYSSGSQVESNLRGNALCLMTPKLLDGCREDVQPSPQILNFAIVLISDLALEARIVCMSMGSLTRVANSSQSSSGVLRRHVFSLILYSASGRSVMQRTADVARFSHVRHC